jgi:dihydrofolate reductase
MLLLRAWTGPSPAVCAARHDRAGADCCRRPQWCDRLTLSEIEKPLDNFIMQIQRRPRTVALRAPRITYIVARSSPGNVIGCDNELPWSLPTDMANFRRVTIGHAIIMGRRTLESIGKALPKRKNIVLSRDLDPTKYKGVTVVSTIADAIWEADIYSILNGKKEFFVIGGDQIYKLFEPFCQKIILTEVYSKEIVGDAFFETEFDRREWKIIEELDFVSGDRDENGVIRNNQYPFRISTYERRDAHARTLPLRDFLTQFEFRNELSEFDVMPAIDDAYFVDEPVQQALFD